MKDHIENVGDKTCRNLKSKGNLKTMDLDKLETLIRELSVFD